VNLKLDLECDRGLEPRLFQFELERGPAQGLEQLELEQLGLELKLEPRTRPGSKST
jgi:hypothetical protein